MISAGVDRVWPRKVVNMNNATTHGSQLRISFSACNKGAIETASPSFRAMPANIQFQTTRLASA